MGLFSFIWPLWAPKSVKSEKIPREFELVVGRGHPRRHLSRCQSKAHMLLPISH